MNSPDILDYRLEPAMAKALARRLIDRARLEDFDSRQDPASALLATDRPGEW